jgi:light-regulated signal transduction histidine kinase (bacteriophytochrome)
MPRRATTGYNRTYAMWLLNHVQEVQHSPQQPRHYGPAVQHALFLVKHVANRICAKRLIPFLPTLVEALERHEHLHLTENCRRQLLSMSEATADRLLRSQRKRGQLGLSTTRAATLLKQQIPNRTFEEWKETRPGFLEAERARPLWQGHRGRLRVHADADRFGDWVDNMSSPSVPESGNGLHISQQMLEMLVCDNGMGIPVEHLERVFDRFPCVDTRIMREVNGLGLGLTMCKRVAQMLGVMILAENKPHGKGSVVHVRLPTDEIPSM